MTTKQEMTVIMARSAAAFPNSKPDKVTMQVYYELLGEIPADELMQAMDNCIKQPGRVFPPTIGELREAWQEYRESRHTRALPELSAGTPPVYIPMPDSVREKLGKLIKSKETKHGNRNPRRRV